MIKDRINKQVLASLMAQDRGLFEWENNCKLDIIFTEELYELIDEFLAMLDGDTIPEMQRQISVILTTSKHLLPFSKHQLIWFQRSLGRLKSVRSGIKN